MVTLLFWCQPQSPWDKLGFITYWDLAGALGLRAWGRGLTIDEGLSKHVELPHVLPLAVHLIFVK